MFAASGPQQPKAKKGASGDATIVDIASDDGRFDILVTALQEAELAETLDGDDQFTVFAPTNEGFEDLADELGVGVPDLLELEILTNILLYHVTDGRRYAASVVNPAPVEMLNGGLVETNGTVLNDGQAKITTTTIEASNGVIHPIDGVLLPS